MKVSEMFPSKYIKAADLEDKSVTLRIKHVKAEEIGEDKKHVLYFQNTERGMVLNKTNTRVIAAAYGNNTEMWENKSITLFMAMVDFKGDMVEGIRVKVPKTAAAPKPAPEPHSEINPPDYDMDDIPF